MRILNAILILLAVGITAVAAVRWRTLSQLKAQMPTVESAPAAASAPSAEITSELDSLREQTRDLPRLRNEVSRLRGATNELVALEKERTRLEAAKRTGAAMAAPAPPGFVGKEQLADLGFATPENTMQTFFWAMRETNVNRMFETWSEEMKRRHFKNDRAKAEAEFSQAAPQMMKAFHNIGIARTEVVSPAEQILYVQSSFSPTPMKMTFVLEGGEWKIKNMFE